VLLNVYLLLLRCLLRCVTLVHVVVTVVVTCCVVCCTFTFTTHCCCCSPFTFVDLLRCCICCVCLFVVVVTFTLLRCCYVTHVVTICSGLRIWIDCCPFTTRCGYALLLRYRCFAFTVVVVTVVALPLRCWLRCTFPFVCVVDLLHVSLFITVVVVVAV